MGKPKKKGAYEHFCVLIFAQGTWTDQDIESIRGPLLEKRKMQKDLPYPLFTKLVRSNEKPTYGDCHICGPIYDLLKEIQGSNDGILYQGHHYIIPEDDLDDMKELARLIMNNNKVKKLYILYLDSFGEIERNIIKKWELSDLKANIQHKKCSLVDFEKVIDDDNFRERIVYEIYRAYV